MRTKTDTDRIILPSINTVPKESWSSLAQSRIFFGHQSVGYNIIEGIKDVMKEHDDICLNIVETSDPAQFVKPVFSHSQVGRNTDPFSKIESFKNILNSGVGSHVDIAFFKLCYVDISSNSNPEEIFNSYTKTVEELKDRYPRTKFLHFTIPIRSVSKGALDSLKQTVKSLMGKHSVLEDNIVRTSYNKLLTDAYRETEPFFDLALAESVNSCGSRCLAGREPGRTYVMAPEYTDDGGHLNSFGRKTVAEQLLITLAGIANSS